MLELKGVCKSYKKNNVLKNINMTINKGEIVGIVGLNGAGKSTLMNIISGATKSDYGKVLFEGIDCSYIKSKHLRNKISMLSTSNNLYNELSVEENLNISRRIYDATEYDMKRVIKDMNLEGFLSKGVSRLSTGMRRRVEIACATMGNFSVLLLDEPTNGLDIEAKEKVLRYIKYIAKPNNTVVITSHNTKDIERLCDRIYVIKDGEIIKSSTVENMISDAKNNSIWLIKVKNKEGVLDVVKNNRLRRRIVGDTVEILVNEEMKKNVILSLADYDIISIKSVINDLEDAIRVIIKED